MALLILALGASNLWLAYLGTDHVKAAVSLSYNSVFTGSTPFWKWEASLILLYAVGQIPGMEDIASAFMALILIVIVLKHSGAFDNFMKVF